MNRADRKAQVRQCLGFVQLIFGPPWPMNQLNKNPNIAYLDTSYRLCLKDNPLRSLQARCYWNSRKQRKPPSRPRDFRFPRDGDVIDGERLSKDGQPAAIHRPASRVRVGVAHGQVSDQDSFSSS